MTGSTQIARRPSNIRSRVGNGSSLFVDDSIDGRTKHARRFRDVLTEIINDLGGVDRLSEGEKQLARRCALLSVECEKMEGEAILGREINLETFGRLSDRLGRGFQRLGLKRVAREASVDPLAEYFSKPFRGDGE